MDAKQARKTASNKLSDNKSKRWARILQLIRRAAHDGDFSITETGALEFADRLEALGFKVNTGLTTTTISW